jgi:hypothetical protein
VPVLYLLDADTLITADRRYYPMARFPVFWEWLRHNGAIGNVKIPREQYDEIVAGRGELVDWLRQRETADALLFAEESDPELVARVTGEGYAADLDDSEIETIGRDPFLIAHALRDQADRCVVSFEVSAPAKQRANRKVPDVCHGLGVRCITLFELITDLDFTTNWRPV